MDSMEKITDALLNLISKDEQDLQKKHLYLQKIDKVIHDLETAIVAVKMMRHVEKKRVLAAIAVVVDN